MSPALLGRAEGDGGRAIAAAVQLARPSYECNFYLHNFKLILRLSHAQSQKGRRGRGGRKSEKKATANLFQKRINEIKLSLFRRNASHSHWMLACRGGPQSGGVVAEEAGRWGQEEGSCNAAAFCFLYVVSSCWFFFAFLLFFPFNCNAYLRPLSLPLSLSLFFGHRVSLEFLVKLDGQRGERGCCSRQPETSSSNNTYKSFVCLVWLGQLLLLLLLLSRSHTYLL